MAPATEHTTLRELDHRGGDGIDVSLLWNAKDDTTFVFVDDERSGRRLRIAVDGANALDAFRHPYAYALLEVEQAA
jgi:hypothetical protein